jgi:adenylate cyclase
MEGRLAFESGDLARATECLRKALDRFTAADYGIEMMRTHRALAAVELARGNRSDAEEQLRRAIDLADARDAALQGNLARQRLAELGVEIEQRTGKRQPVSKGVGERLVTVLFLDIRGYTSMTAREAPERVVETVSNLYRWARQEVERHEGVVDRYEGDAVMATFNVAGSRLDHCLQALQAAIAIRDKAAASGLPIGAGIAVGPAVVGQLTSASQVSTFGEVTNLAARLQASAEAGEVLLTEEAYRRTRDWLDEKEQSVRQESLVLKGYSAPITAFRLALPAKTKV